MTNVGIEAGMACSARPTGVEHFARSVVQALALLPAPPGVRLHLYLAPVGLPSIAFPDWICVHRRPEMNSALKPAWLSYRSWLDRLQVFFTFTNDTPCLVRGHRVATVWDTIFDEFPDSYAAGLPARYRRETSRAVSRHGTLATLADNTASALRDGYGFRGDLLIMGGGARSGLEKTPPEQPFEADLSALKRPFFFALSRIDRRKNLPRVVRAYRQLVAGGFQGGLLLAGPKDSGWAELQQTLENDPVPGESIVVSDYLSDSDVHQAYRQALGFLYPSLAEGLGLPILEALTSGAPTIASNRSPMRELLGSAGLLIDPESVDSLSTAMRQLAEDGDLRDRLRAQGPLQAARFSWEDVAERLLQRLIQKGSHGRFPKETAP